MKTYMKAADPDRIEMTLTVTMPLKQWRKLQEQLVSEYPSWDLSGQIADMVTQATRSFSPEEKLS